jgi:hypothetical protein
METVPMQSLLNMHAVAKLIEEQSRDREQELRSRRFRQTYINKFEEKLDRIMGLPSGPTSSKKKFHVNVWHLLTVL